MIVRLIPAAQEDVREAASWYGERDAALGQQFVSALSDGIAQIVQFPESSPRVHGEIRRLLLHRFPYCVFYLVEPSGPVVLGCFHARRDPKAWQRRAGV